MLSNRIVQKVCVAVLMSRGISTSADDRGATIHVTASAVTAEILRIKVVE